ncbi:ABC-type transport system involved in multi-copper enzyme maturation permease subunit [Thermocatellispora tengchongensis]|uniref:ABC-type transport system involved in multi-copper enzyme maturation permease subunit n=1 Tax=Thermocatellispora tengchongensis TaxID=1073253 RepID=A0A840PIS3_9ACTN|nr:ABC transporter permease [Thermocatellispora tengchongensis]MBB5137711.1 ABC-type transport system involved in multi-copper enzyme maturation permease subunit [Thermocatellispora tengchongensis]
MTDVLRSEWIKIRSVRSTLWTLLTTVVVMIALGFLIAASTASLGERAAFDPTMASLSGGSVASLVIAALGVLVISGEYRTGMIHTSLLAVPDRLRLLTAKIAVFSAVAFAVSLAASLASFLVGAMVFGEDAPGLGDPGVLRAVLGSALFLTAGGLYGLAFGALIRHTAGAIVAVAAATVVLPQMTNLLPGTWGDVVHDYFTTNAGQRILSASPQDGGLGPWAGFGVYCAWITLTMVPAALLMVRRDA